MLDNFQVTFFENIILLYDKRSDAIDAFIKLLNLNRDAVYRRVRGDTSITLEEMKRLAVHHKVSIDNMYMKMHNDVLFTFNSFEEKIQHVDDFVLNLIHLLQQFSLAKDAKVFYASAEIPVFYHAFVPELFVFKLYVWARTVWNLPHYKDSKFSFDIISQDSLQKIKQITSLYKNLESIELWSYNIFDNTLNQIEYHLDGAFFKNEDDALSLCEALLTICESMRSMALNGYKSSHLKDPTPGASFTLYHNEIAYTNNTILYNTPNVEVLFTTFCNPNFIVTRDPRICSFSHDWFDTIIGKSQLISGANEKARNKFFDGIQKRILMTRKRIEVMLGYL